MGAVADDRTQAPGEMWALQVVGASETLVTCAKPLAQKQDEFVMGEGARTIFGQSTKVLYHVRKNPPDLRGVCQRLRV